MSDMVFLGCPVGRWVRIGRKPWEGRWVRIDRALGGSLLKIQAQQPRRVDFIPILWVRKPSLSEARCI